MKSANTIPQNYPVCMYEECPLAERCLHQLAFRRQEEMGTYLRLLNPSKCTKQAGCPHYVDSKPVRLAKGFTGFQKKMYPEQYERWPRSYCISVVTNISSAEEEIYCFLQRSKTSSGMYSNG